MLRYLQTPETVSFIAKYKIVKGEHCWAFASGIIFRLLVETPHTWPVIRSLSSRHLSKTLATDKLIHPLVCIRYHLSQMPFEIGLSKPLLKLCHYGWLDPTLLLTRNYLWIGTETCWVDNVFPPDDLWFNSDTDELWIVNCEFLSSWLGS